MQTSLSCYYDPPFTALMDENLKSHGIQLEFGQTVKKSEVTAKWNQLLPIKENTHVIWRLSA